MEYVYNGLFADIYNWILDHILSPIVEFLGWILNSILSWTFEYILEPILKAVFEYFGKFLIKMLAEIFSGIIYGIFKDLLYFIDTMNHAFNIMIGLDTVVYNGQNVSLVDALFHIPQIRTIYLTINLIGVAMAIILAAYATAKSVLDFDFDNKRPVSRVLSATFKTLINLATLHLFVTFMYMLAQAILKAINQAINLGGSSTTLGRIIFCLASMNAAIDTRHNLNAASTIDEQIAKLGTSDVSKSVRQMLESSKQNLEQVGFTDSVRKRFYEVNKEYGYDNTSAVKQYFKLSQFDYVLGFIMAIFIIIIMSSCLMVFIERIFDMLMLYIISPFFVATMPLDDGERFQKWRDLFIGKCFSGFGMVVSMKLFIMLCPTIVNTNVLKFNSQSVEMDYLMRCVFILGGAWAILKSGTMVTSLISDAAGQQEQGAAAMGKGLAIGGLLIAKNVTSSFTKGAAGLVFSGSKDKGDENKDKEAGGEGGSRESGSDQAFTGKGGSAVSAGSGSSDQAFTGRVAGGIGIAGGKTAGGMGAGTGTAGGIGAGAAGGSAGAGAGAAGGSAGAGAGTAGGSAGAGAGAFAGRAGAAGGSAGAGTRTAAAGAAKPEGTFKRFLRTKRRNMLNKLGFKQSWGADGKEKFTWKPFGGKLANIGIDKDGKKHFSILGFGASWDDKGIDKISCGVVDFKKGQDGFQVKSFGAFGINAEYSDKGKLYMKDCSLIGMHKKMDKNGDPVMTSLGIIGLKRQKDAGGNYVTSNLFGSLIDPPQDNRRRDKDGNLT